MDWLGIGYYNFTATYDFFTRIKIINHINFNKYLEFSKLNIYDSILLNDAAIVIEMPEHIKHINYKLHSIETSTIRFKDGYELFFIDGVKFDKELWEKISTKKITSEEIFSIENAEQKAVVLRQIGYDVVLKNIEHKILDTHSEVNSVGELIKYELIETDLKDDIGVKARFIKVQCHTTLKETLLRVDPRIKETEDCIGAVAWTAGMSKKEYILEQQT